MSWVYLLYEKQHCKGNLRGNWLCWNMRRTVFGMVLASNLLGILAPVILKHMSSEIQLKQGRIRGWLTDFPGKGKRKMAPADAFFGLSYASLRNGDRSWKIKQSSARHQSEVTVRKGGNLFEALKQINFLSDRQPFKTFCDEKKNKEGVW